MYTIEAVDSDGQLVAKLRFTSADDAFKVWASLTCGEKNNIAHADLFDGPRLMEGWTAKG